MQIISCKRSHQVRENKAIFNHDKVFNKQKQSDPTPTKQYYIYKREPQIALVFSRYE